MPSSTPVRVRLDDTDLFGVVHHAKYLSYLEIGRIGWLRARGVAIADWIERGTMLAVIEVSLRYRGAARVDDVLIVDTTLKERGAATLRFDVRIRRDKTELGEGFVRLVSLDRSGRIRRFDEEQRALLDTTPSARTPPSDSFS